MCGKLHFLFQKYSELGGQIIELRIPKRPIDTTDEVMMTHEDMMTK